MLKNRLSSEEDMDTEEIKAYAYYEQQVIQKIHHFYINTYISDAMNYTDMLHKINTATMLDTIHMHLNTEGGDLFTGLQIINALKSTEAHVICSLESAAYSLGSMIFLCADEFVVYDNSMMLIHNFSGGIDGKGNEQVSQLQATSKWFKALAEDYYLPFLTKSELDMVLNDKDIWLHAPDIRKRLNKIVKNSTK